MGERIICLTDQEAALACRGELRAIVRVWKQQPDLSRLKNPDEPLEVRRVPILGPTHVPPSEYAIYMKKSAPGNVPICGAPDCPVGAPGDVLLGKESWQKDLDKYVYKADWTPQHPSIGVLGSWRSPVTMPLWAIRRRFTNKSVRAMQKKDLRTKELDALGFNFWLELVDAYKITSPDQWIWYAELEVK